MFINLNIRFVYIFFKSMFQLYAHRIKLNIKYLFSKKNSNIYFFIPEFPLCILLRIVIRWAGGAGVGAGRAGRAEGEENFERSFPSLLSIRSFNFRWKE